MKNESGSETKPEDKSEQVVDEVAEKVTAASFTPFVQQKHWRWIGVVCLLIAAALAFASVSTNILRDSIVSVALIFWEGTSDPSPAFPITVYILYWGLFGLSIFLAFYMVMLDLRYIRLEYTLEKRALMKESLEDEEIRKLMQLVHEKSRESKE